MHTKIYAILPEEVKGKGICARIYTDTTTYIDIKTPELLLDHMYKAKGKRKKEVDTLIKSLLQINKNTPYVIDANNVFFGFKFRRSTYDKSTRGFANVRYVSHIEDNHIILTTGESIATLSQFKSLNQNKNHAITMMLSEMVKDYENREEMGRFVRGRIIRG